MTPTIAMHMANELLNVPVAVATLALGAVAVWLSAAVARGTLDAEKLPLMGVMGAFVFAAQMINFTLPGMPGTSGHLGGGVLLAILLGPAGGILTMASILIVQCLIFQDGGLLALGCNIINMGVVPCLAGWGVYRLLIGRGVAAPAWRQYLVAWLACVVGVAGGAALVPIEAAFAGRLVIPVGDFLGVMVGVHLLIGAVEGAITFAVIAYLRQVRPGLVGLPAAPGAGKLGRKAVAASMLATALLLAGVVSWFASSHPDGLEWSYTAHKYGQAGEAVKPAESSVAAVDELQAKYTPLPEYSARSAPLGRTAPGTAEVKAEGAGDAWPNVSGWGSLAGLIGTAGTLLVLYLVAVLLRRRARTRATREA